MEQDEVIRHEISRHEIAVYQACAGRAGKWLTSGEIAGASKVAPRTVRNHVAWLAALGVLDVADEVYPGRRYRLPADAGDGPRSYADRLRRAAEVLGVGLQGTGSADSEPETVSFVVERDADYDEPRTVQIMVHSDADSEPAGQKVPARPMVWQGRSAQSGVQPAAARTEGAGTATRP
jgi:hypothetical protein